MRDGFSVADRIALFLRGETISCSICFRREHGGAVSCSLRTQLRWLLPTGVLGLDRALRRSG